MEDLSAKELRIGNIVRSKINGISKVEQIGSLINPEYVGGRSLEGDYWENSYLPIPLTEEWLTKFGYQLNDWRFSITKPANYDGFLLCDGYAVITDRIKYVHELQNLYFALTGEELELKTKTL